MASNKYLAIQTSISLRQRALGDEGMIEHSILYPQQVFISGFAASILNTRTQIDERNSIDLINLHDECIGNDVAFSGY